jgi:hypothetical protein
MCGCDHDPGIIIEDIPPNSNEKVYLPVFIKIHESFIDQGNGETVQNIINAISLIISNVESFYNIQLKNVMTPELIIVPNYDADVCMIGDCDDTDVLSNFKTTAHNMVTNSEKKLAERMAERRNEIQYSYNNKEHAIGIFFTNKIDSGDKVGKAYPIGKALEGYNRHLNKVYRFIVIAKTNKNGSYDFLNLQQSSIILAHELGHILNDHANPFFPITKQNSRQYSCSNMDFDMNIEKFYDEHYNPFTAYFWENDVDASSDCRGIGYKGNELNMMQSYILNASISKQLDDFIFFPEQKQRVKDIILLQKY